MSKILIATTNAGKFKEILSALLPHEGLEFLSLNDVGIDTDVEETGATYGENAMIKALHYYDLAGIPTIAEDSGVEISALQNELGVHTRRWGAGPTATDDEWLSHFMDRMATEEDRAARFVCHSVFIDAEGHAAFEGTCEGIITPDIEGPVPRGIPLSSVFKPIGSDKVYSVLPEEEKNQLSHRGKAIKALRDYLMQKYG